MAAASRRRDRALDAYIKTPYGSKTEKVMKKVYRGANADYTKKAIQYKKQWWNPDNATKGKRMKSFY